MKEQLLELARRAATPVLAGNLAREYLQARILLAMQEAGAMIPLAFQGGTALRFLFELPRFSEDLDFALERPERGEYGLEALDRRVTARPFWPANSTRSSSGNGPRAGISSTSSGT